MGKMFHRKVVSPLMVAIAASAMGDVGTLKAMRREVIVEDAPPQRERPKVHLNKRANERRLRQIQKRASSPCR